MTDALDRSLLLAAAMDSRGYGRTAHVPQRTRRLTGTLVLAGLIGVCIGIYGLLDGSSPWTLGVPMLAVGLLAAGLGFVIGGQRVQRSRYRADPWLLAEWGVSAIGILVATTMFAAAVRNPTSLNPSLQPLQWPTLPLLPTLAILLGALPAWIAPPPVRS